MGSSSGIACLVVMCMVLSAPHAQAAVTCGSVASALSPCIGYVTKGGVVPPACCNGIKNLYKAATTTPDRKTVCTCLKGFAGSTSYPLAAGIPGKCGSLKSIDPGISPPSGLHSQWWCKVI
ncbi:non-specific lipid-transfer protein 1-like [Impatiens glandulifera]|uniref:non-specific lipid-transfer protein 1-like n=1 Tax=Impatiens glandulifera TaxID=253017 RepID=UPI001FB0CFD9|nr:non-specific lipid-transfer protein 1-like [Impatiens glandulifera]